MRTTIVPYSPLVMCCGHKLTVASKSHSSAGHLQCCIDNYPSAVNDIELVLDGTRIPDYGCCCRRKPDGYIRDVHVHAHQESAAPATGISENGLRFSAIDSMLARPSFVIFHQRTSLELHDID